jgi:four helix bundle protein
MFIALDLAIQLARTLREPLRALRLRDRRLAEQIENAANSAALNLSEGRQRLGRDRIHLYSVSAGSAAEVHTALELSVAWGHLQAAQLGESLAILDRLRAILWVLTRRK